MRAPHKIKKKNISLAIRIRIRIWQTMSGPQYEKKFRFHNTAYGE
jgi:hypothetical protein